MYLAPSLQIADTPVEFIVEYLLKAKEIADNNANVPAELRDNLQKALDIASGLDGYLENMSSQESEPLAELYRKSMSHDWDKAYEDGKTLFRLPITCITGRVEGQVLKMLVHMSKAKRVLEIGMFTGYGALSMAEALPQNGQLIACELEPFLKDFSKPIFDKSPHGKKIMVKTGPAMETLKELAATGEQFDLVFIDADKQNYINYYKFLMDHNLLRMDGVICVDNTLFKGRVYLKDAADEMGIALRDFGQFVTNDPRVEQNNVTYDEVFEGVQGKAVLDRMRLDGKVAYVTGAGQGIGRAFAHALGEAGAKVAIIDLDKEKAENVACIPNMAVSADISKPEEVQKMIDDVVSKWGTIHIACNNAGINKNSASEHTSLEEWDQTFNVNLRGTFMCCQAAGRVMLKQGYGKIINTASMASLIGVGFGKENGEEVKFREKVKFTVPHPQKQLSYNTSKAGVVKLTQTLGTEWIDRGIRVNCISPGIVDTPLIHSESLEPLVQRWLSDIPAGRLAQVTDLQAAVVYLASDASDYMTGHNLVIEGGQSLW
ncbi:3-hydroxybutyrate dehydrogenase type 2 [Triplophysa tibetana]|uniref:3-hydroxybutyrate dehydrogenase type 2 n=1 Tax=Triplophysa tibetana TaxID=1572043 RepID=A0A5A9NUJ7_9TELE|nr:3-hydroxybutyrate dehydrogenase type 2 [Triplophysa tibetana]